MRAGGGSNHRYDLGSGVLIKDNHLAVAGSLAAAVRQARAVAPHGMKIEVEVDTLDQLDQALAAGADIILLDNFAAADVARAVERAHGRQPAAAAGGLGRGHPGHGARPGRDRRRHPLGGRPHPLGPRGRSVAGAAAGAPAHG